MNETFMKEKPIFPLLLGMGMPMVLSMLVNSLYNIVDSYFVARISENAMEALSLVFPIQNFINAMAIGFGVGINALIATARGAGKENEARRAATQGVVLSVIHGITDQESLAEHLHHDLNRHYLSTQLSKDRP